MNLKLPTIKIGKVILREISEADYIDYYIIGSDAETTKYLNWGPFVNPQEALWVIREIFLKRPLDNLPIGYAITYNDEMIGIIDFHTYFPKENTCEIGYILNRRFWNKGIMSKCLRKITEVGFNYLNYDKLLVGHTIDNEASKHVILNSGYHYEYERLVNIKNQDKIALYYAQYRYEFSGGV